MALDVNGYSETFKAFVDFAKISDATSGGKTIVRASVDETGALVGREVKAAETDRLRGLFRWFRSSDDKMANNETRRIFKDAIIKMFGGESKIPPSVTKAMLMSDYNSGKPLTARRIIAVQKAIDANGVMKQKAFDQEVVKFNDPNVKAAALAKGYSEAELPKVARAMNLYVKAMGVSEAQALEQVTTPGSKANRLMNYGGRFVQTAENFANGLRLIDSFANWFKDIVETMRPVYEQIPKTRDFSRADTPTKLNISGGLLCIDNTAGLEKFMFEELATNPKYNLSETNAENLFGFKNNAAMRFFGRGYGSSVCSTLAGMPPAKRRVLYAVMDLFTKNAKDAQQAHDQNLGIGHLTKITDTNSPKFINRIIRHLDAVEQLQREGKLTAKNILDKFFPDIQNKGKYDCHVVDKAFDDLSVMLHNEEDEGNIYSDIKPGTFLMMLESTGSTIEETAAAIRAGKQRPIPKYICSGAMELKHFNGTTQGGRGMLEADLIRPSNYGYVGKNVELLSTNGAGAAFRFNFPGGESLHANNSPEGKANIKTIGDKIVALCGEVHVDQANSVMTMVTHSGLSSLRNGLPGIDCDEHAAVDMTLSKDEATGDVTIHYSSPKELKFSFGWTATVKPDGSVTTTPFRFMSEEQLKAAVDMIKGEVNAARKDPALDKAIENLIESVKGDPDLVELLQYGICDAARKVLLDSQKNIRSEEDQLKKLNELKGNLNELRQVTNGDLRTYDMVFKQLICFNGKALNPGTITKLFEAAKKIDVSALSLPANASPKKVAEYFCNVEKAVDKVIVGTRVWQEMGIGLGSADALPLNKLVMSMLYSRCDKETLQRSLNELSTDNGFKVVKACDNISDDEYPRSVGIQVARQEAPLTKAVQNIAKSFSAPATYRQSIFETLASSLDVEIPDEPDFNTLNLTDDEFAGIYQTFKQHTIEDHPEMIEKERNASPITYTNLD